MKRNKAALLAACIVIAAPAWAAGDAAIGRQLYDTRCAGCHSVDDNRVGPAHRGVFGRKAGTQRGFTYSEALRKAGIVWNDKTLDAWLTAPEKLVPGQWMNVQGARGPGRVPADLDRALKHAISTSRRGTGPR